MKDRKLASRYARALISSLSDKQKAKVDEILDGYIEEAKVAIAERDWSLGNDLKKDLEKDLKKVVGSKKAKDIINNINRQSGWGRGR